MVGVIDLFKPLCSSDSPSEEAVVANKKLSEEEQATLQVLEKELA